ncbi:MAG: hypothetical protein CL581_13935 [Alteromonadaceae bacterium]|nr:hypothetical protein [Alteromonadaceae bacterium]MBH85462.1 hypothetical protein [Alteromonadaceae bacterium]
MGICPFCRSGGSTALTVGKKEVTIAAGMNRLQQADVRLFWRMFWRALLNSRPSILNGGNQGNMQAG